METQEVVFTTEELFGKKKPETQEVFSTEELFTPKTQNALMVGAQKAVNPYGEAEERGAKRFSPKYWKQLFTSDYWDETWKGIKKYPGELVAPVVEAIKKPVEPVEPSPWAAQYGLPMREVEHPITGEGRQAIQTTEAESGLKSAAGTAWGFAKWLPELLIDLYKDPLKTIKERPGDIILAAGTSIAGSAIKRIGGKLKGKVAITPPEIIAATEEARVLQSKIKPAEQPPIIPEPTKQQLTGITYKGQEIGQPRSLEPLVDVEAEQAKIKRIADLIKEPTGPKGLSIQPVGEKGPMTMAEAMKVTPKPREEVPLAVKPKFELATTLDPLTQKLLDVVKEAKPMRGEQEKIYTKIRGERIAEGLKRAEGLEGEAYFNAVKSALPGEMPKIRFESIAQRFSPEERIQLFNKVRDTLKLSDWEQLPAAKGLGSILDDIGGAVPTEGELILLQKVFGPEVIKEVLGKRELWPRVRDVLYEVANVPRAIMASFDLSFPFRQGIFLSASHPKEFLAAFAEQVKYFRSEKAFRAGMEEIGSRPTYKYMIQDKKMGRKQGLALTEMGPILGLREERFLSPMAEKIGEIPILKNIPILGQALKGMGGGIKASGRAYTGGLNRLRADVFDSLFYDAQKMGLKPEANPAILDGISEFVNVASGRGSSKSLGHSTMILNSIFFSPRLMLSRLQLFNPYFYWKLPKPVRMDAIKSGVGLLGASATILSLAKLGGADVSLDPRSSDFAKIKIGNTRIDIGGGFQQYIRTFAQLASKQVVSTQTGKVTELGSKFGAPTRLDIAARALEYKTTPLVSLVMNALRGKTVFGEKLNIPEEILQRFTPMVVQDFVDLAKDDPKLTPLSLLGVVGFGLQTYKPRPTKPGSQYFYMK